MSSDKDDEPSKRDRLNIDVKGLRDRIRNARNDPYWQEAGLATLARALIIERLDQIEAEKEKSSQENS